MRLEVLSKYNNLHAYVPCGHQHDLFFHLQQELLVVYRRGRKVGIGTKPGDLGTVGMIVARGVVTRGITTGGVRGAGPTVGTITARGEAGAGTTTARGDGARIARGDGVRITAVVTGAIRGGVAARGVRGRGTGG